MFIKLFQSLGLGGAAAAGGAAAGGAAGAAAGGAAGAAAAAAPSAPAAPAVGSYARVSSGPQTTLPDQQALATRYAAARGLVITERLSEVGSAYSEPDALGLGEFLQRLHGGALIISTEDRFARNSLRAAWLIDYCRRHRIAVHVAGAVPDYAAAVGAAGVGAAAADAAPAQPAAAHFPHAYVCEGYSGPGAAGWARLRAAVDIAEAEARAISARSTSWQAARRIIRTEEAAAAAEEAAEARRAARAEAARLARVGGPVAAFYEALAAAADPAGRRGGQAAADPAALGGPVFRLTSGNAYSAAPAFRGPQLGRRRPEVAEIVPGVIHLRTLCELFNAFGALDGRFKWTEAGLAADLGAGAPRRERGDLHGVCASAAPFGTRWGAPGRGELAAAPTPYETGVLNIIRLMVAGASMSEFYAAVNAVAPSAGTPDELGGSTQRLIDDYGREFTAIEPGRTGPTYIASFLNLWELYPRDARDARGARKTNRWGPSDVCAVIEHFFGRGALEACQGAERLLGQPGEELVDLEELPPADRKAAASPAAPLAASPLANSQLADMEE